MATRTRRPNAKKIAAQIGELADSMYDGKPYEDFKALAGQGYDLAVQINHGNLPARSLTSADRDALAEALRLAPAFIVR